MPVTGLILRTALVAVGAVGKQLVSFDELARGADGALRQAPAGLTAMGAAAFLATMAQESDYFRTTTEYRGGGAAYAPYVGRTFEQVTWAANYGHMGQWCHRHGLVADPQVFVKNPTSLANIKWAWLGGIWYFEYASLWHYANRGDFLAVSQGVNRGRGSIGTKAVPNGWPARQAMYQALRAAGPALLPVRVGADTGLRRRRTHLIN